MSSINDFILEIENHSAHNTNASAPSSPKRKRIPRVPQELLSMKDSQEYFEPAVISLGPYYHGNSKYERMEPVKRNIVRQFFVKWRAPIKDIYDKIHNQIKEVRDYYEEQSTDRVADEELTFMMLIDGALLFVCLLYPSSFYPEVTVTERKSFLRDLVLLENQIPFMVIKVFVESIRGLNHPFCSLSDAAVLTYPFLFQNGVVRWVLLWIISYTSYNWRKEVLPAMAKQTSQGYLSSFATTSGKLWQRGSI